MRTITLVFTWFGISLNVAAYGQTLDLDFETWTKKEGIQPGTADTSPEGWSLRVYGAARTTEAHSGNSAVLIWNWYNYAQGVLSTGNSGYVNERSVIDAGYPIAFKPARIKGFYRYELDNNEGPDSGQVIVYLKRRNPETNKRDTIGYGYAALPPAGSYTPFEVPIVDYQPGVDPDSIAIAFFSSKDGFCDEQDANCCYLWLDALTLEATSGVEQPLDGLTHVPPEVRLIETEKELLVIWQYQPALPYSIVLFDVNGKQMQVWNNLRMQREPLPLREPISLGIYFYEVRSAEQIPVQGKIILN